LEDKLRLEEITELEIQETEESDSKQREEELSEIEEEDVEEVEESEPKEREEELSEVEEEVESSDAEEAEAEEEDVLEVLQDGLVNNSNQPTELPVVEEEVELFPLKDVMLLVVDQMPISASDTIFLKTKFPTRWKPL